MSNAETGMAAVDASAPVFAPPDGQAAGGAQLLIAPASPAPLAPILSAVTAPSPPRPSSVIQRIPLSAGGAGAIYGALDLGTNNCRLLVARPSRRGFFVIDAFSRIIKLGEGVSRTGVLSEEAMARTIDALKICSSKMARRGVTRSRLVATEACRIAKNGGDFIARVERETGLSLEIIGRETEARLAVSGCASLIDKQSDYVLIFDIGGGSSEFVWLNLAKERPSRRVSIEDRLRAQESIEAWTSLPFGVVTLAERFGKSSVEGHQFEEMVTFVQGGAETVQRPQQHRRENRRGRRAPARHIRNRHHHCRRLSGPFGISSRQGRRLLAFIPKHPRRVQAHRRHELPAARRRALHRQGAGRSHTGWLRHHGGDAQGLARQFPKGRRPWLAGRHTGHPHCRGSDRWAPPGPKEWRRQWRARQWIAPPPQLLRGSPCLI